MPRFTRETTTNNKNKTNHTKAKSKAGSWIEGQVATILESHARQTQKQWNEQWKNKNNQEETKQKCRLGTASNEITGGGVGGGLQLVCGRPSRCLSQNMKMYPMIINLLRRFFTVMFVTSFNSFLFVFNEFIINKLLHVSSFSSVMVVTMSL